MIKWLKEESFTIILAVGTILFGLSLMYATKDVIHRTTITFISGEVVTVETDHSLRNRYWEPTIKFNGVEYRKSAIHSMHYRVIYPGDE